MAKQNIFFLWCICMFFSMVLGEAERTTELVEDVFGDNEHVSIDDASLSHMIRWVAKNKIQNKFRLTKCQSK